MNSAPSDRNVRSAVSPASIVVWTAGTLAILAAVVLAPPPPSDTSPGGIPAGDGFGLHRLTADAAARVRMLESIAGEPEARGCTASARGEETDRTRILLSVLCGRRGDLEFEIGHAPIGVRAPAGSDDCLGASSGRGLTCRSSGSAGEGLRRELTSAFGRVFERTFPEDPFAPQRSWDTRAAAVATGIAILAIFLWLAAAGAFTYGSAGERDWVALVPFAAALAVRELLTLHSIQEIEIQFALTPVGRHSVVYPLFQLLYAPFARDPQAATFHVNAVLGALATLPLYLFVRQRTGDRAAAFVASCFFAVHPLVARFAPTDGPYSFLLFAWFAGLALLSAPAADARSTIGGAVLIGIAASARMDGLFYLAASALLLDPALLLARIRNAPKAASLAAAAIALLIAVQMYFLLGFHWRGMRPDSPVWSRLRQMWELSDLRATRGDGAWSALVAAGALSGIARRWRLGSAAFAALLLLLITTPFAVSPLWLVPPAGESPNAWHRFVPSAALQCIVAGTGAVALAAPLVGARRRAGWAASLPGIAAALYVLAAHRPMLAEQYVFNEEYQVLREHLAKDGIADLGSDLFVMTRKEKDVEIRDFARVVPGMAIVDCSSADCARGLAAGRPQYYLRSAACFFHPEGVPEPCSRARSDEEIRRDCLLAECAGFEAAAELEPIAVRNVTTRATFPREAGNYPERIPVGLFRVANGANGDGTPSGRSAARAAPGETPAAARSDWRLPTALTATALVVLPIALGALAGEGLRRMRRRRFSGIVAAIALIGVPVALAAELVLWLPLIGVWDALLEGLFVGAGVAWRAHGWFSDWSQVSLAVVSALVSLLVGELACQLFLPPPPAFPTGAGPHLLLADAIRTGAESHSWDVRSKEIVCSIVYQQRYAGILDVSQERDIATPSRFTPRANARRRVLHIGDSMTFGFGVARDQTFTADLERLEPDTQHINAGIPGTAPDAYLLVMRQWIAAHDVDLVVLYVFEGNDIQGLDDRYPCCHWRSLFTYDSGTPQMRCPTPSAADLVDAGATWLRYNSPAPYLVRALVPHSSAAAYVGAAVANGMLGMPMHTGESEDEAMRHLESILRAARDELRAREIPLVVAVFPSRARVESSSARGDTAQRILQVTARLGVQRIDVADAVPSAVVAGQPIYFDNPSDPHLTPAAHRIVAEWLHERLTRSPGSPPAP